MQGATRAKERKTSHFKFLHFSAVCETQRCPTFSPPVVELLSIDCLPQTVWKLCCHLCKHILSAAKVCLIHCNRNLSYHNKIELELELNVVSQTELRKGICWWAGDFLKAPSFRSPWVCSLLEGLYDCFSHSSASEYWPWRVKSPGRSWGKLVGADWALLFISFYFGPSCERWHALRAGTSFNSLLVWKPAKKGFLMPTCFWSVEQKILEGLHPTVAGVAVFSVFKAAIESLSPFFSLLFTNWSHPCRIR